MKKIKIEFRCIEPKVKTTAETDRFLFKKIKTLFIVKLNFLIFSFIANAQNICNLIGREEYNNGNIVLFFNIVPFD